MTTETTVSADPVAEELGKIREREQAATRGPWTLETDGCDCGGDYPCGHGAFPYAIHMPDPHTERRPGEKHPEWDYLYSEISAMSMATAEFIEAARDDVPRLLRVVEAVRSLCTDTDGNWLPPESEIPVGEFMAALALITGEAAAS